MPLHKHIPGQSEMYKSKERLKELLSEADNAWLNIDQDEIKSITKTFLSHKDLNADPIKEVLGLMRKPENFYWTCKVILNIELLPFQVLILQELWKRPFPMLIASRGAGKSYLLSVYSVLRCLLNQNHKVVVVGSAFRQAKFLYEYCRFIWHNAPILREIVGSTTDNSQGPKSNVDRCTVTLGASQAIFIPVGDGQKIRGERANTVVADEFAAQNREVFETVIAGFGVVSPNPIENVKTYAKVKRMKELGVSQDIVDKVSKGIRSNQVIISGTADFAFNHFYDYWKRWKGIIESKGDKRKLFEMGIEGDIDPKDYSIIRIPYELLPGGFLDEKQVNRAKATVHSGIYMNEYAAVFSKDSQGFIPMSLIKSCTVSSNMDKLTFPKDADVFPALLRGDPQKRYVFGIDPASEINNFAIVITELHAYHARVVHTWTTTKAQYRERMVKGVAKEGSFYNHAARKIRNLMKDFPCSAIAIDTQGGGYSVMEALNDPDNMEEGELPLWPIIDPEKEKPTDNYNGLHIIYEINFAKEDTNNEINHGLRKDMESKVLLFPQFDVITIATSAEDDLKNERIYDTLEDVYMEIEELKKEMATIVQTRTAVSGRDRFDTPEVKKAGGKKGRLNKDRYSALTMSNYAARIIMRNPVIPQPKEVGGFISNRRKYDGGKLYSGIDHAMTREDFSFFGFVKRN